MLFAAVFNPQSQYPILPYHFLWVFYAKSEVFRYKIVESVILYYSLRDPVSCCCHLGELVKSFLSMEIYQVTNCCVWTTNEMLSLIVGCVYSKCEVSIGSEKSVHVIYYSFSPSYKHFEWQSAYLLILPHQCSRIAFSSITWCYIYFSLSVWASVKRFYTRWAAVVYVFYHRWMHITSAVGICDSFSYQCLSLYSVNSQFQSVPCGSCDVE